MCSNTGSGGAADSAGDLGGWTPGSYSRVKRPKIPRRGPGVAELEKILREQEKKDCTTTAQNANLDGHFSRFFSSLPDPYHHSQSLINSLPQPPPPPITTTMHPATPTICSSPSRHVCLVPNLAQFSPPPPDPPLMTSVHGNDSSNTIIGRGGGVVVVGGATVALPEKALLAITWASSKSSVDGVEGSNSDSGIPLPTHIANESIPMSPSPKLLQRRHCQDPSIMVNRNFPGSAAPSSSAVSPAEPYNHIEPPSNQRSSYNYTSLPPQEVKMHGMKRPGPFSEDNAAGPQFHFQVPPLIDPRIPTPDQSSSWYSRSAFNVGPSNKLVFRGTRGDGPSDINSKKFSTTNNNLPDNMNMYRFGCLANNPPATMAHSRQEREFSKLDKLAIRESMEDSDQRSGMGGLDSEKSFHGVFQPKEQMGWKEFTLSSKDEKGNDAGEDGIDLNLKL